jgi:hypothetical protein
MELCGGASVVLARAVSQSSPLDNFPDDGNKGRLEKAKNKLVAKKEPVVKNGLNARL